MNVRRNAPGDYIVVGRYRVIRTREGALHASATAWYWRDTTTGDTSNLVDTKAAAMADLAAHLETQRNERV
jgi:hypothetical protein